MDLIGALKQEESRLQQQLTAVQGAITALNGTGETAVSTGRSRGKRTMSAAGRARISRATKARWAKFRAEQSKAKKVK
jgi:hypothetical protein